MTGKGKLLIGAIVVTLFGIVAYRHWKSKKAKGIEQPAAAETTAPGTDAPAPKTARTSTRQVKVGVRKTGQRGGAATDLIQKNL